MGLETGTYISDLVASNPVATDGLAQADDHLRLIKNAIKASFPSISGAVNATHTELNTVADGGTAATSTTLVNADQLVVNDNGTMVQVALSDLITYLTSNLAITSAMITDGTIQSGDIGNAQVTAAKLAADVITVPAGITMPFAGTVAPAGYIFCFGQDVSRTTYPALFTAIQETYGAGDSVNTFGLPDLRGRVVAGQDNMGGTSAERLTNQTGGLDGDTLGATGGAETHTLSIAQMPTHNHTGTVTLRANFEAGTGPSNLTPLGTGDARFDGRASKPPLDIDNTGGGGAHNNVQPTFILNYVIKT